MIIGTSSLGDPTAIGFIGVRLRILPKPLKRRRVARDRKRVSRDSAGPESGKSARTTLAPSPPSPRSSCSLTSRPLAPSVRASFRVAYLARARTRAPSNCGGYSGVISFSVASSCCRRRAEIGLVPRRFENHYTPQQGGGRGQCRPVVLIRKLLDPPQESDCQESRENRGC